MKKRTVAATGMGCGSSSTTDVKPSTKPVHPSSGQPLETSPNRIPLTNNIEEPKSIQNDGDHSNEISRHSRFEDEYDFTISSNSYNENEITVISLNSTKERSGPHSSIISHHNDMTKPSVSFSGNDITRPSVETIVQSISSDNDDGVTEKADNDRPKLISEGTQIQPDNPALTRVVSLREISEHNQSCYSDLWMPIDGIVYDTGKLHRYFLPRLEQAIEENEELCGLEPLNVERRRYWEVVKILKKCGMTRKEIREGRKVAIIGRLEELCEDEIEADMRKDIDRVLEGIKNEVVVGDNQSDNSYHGDYNTTETPVLHKRFVSELVDAMKRNKITLINTRGLKDTSCDPNKQVFPVPEGFETEDLRDWLAGWVPFKTTFEGSACWFTVERKALGQLCTEDDIKNPPFRPWVADWPHLDVSPCNYYINDDANLPTLGPAGTIYDDENPPYRRYLYDGWTSSGWVTTEGDAWDMLPPGVVMREEMTYEQEHVYQSRQNRDDLWDESKMAERRGELMNYFKSNYDVDNEETRHENWVKELKQGWTQFEKLAEEEGNK